MAERHCPLCSDKTFGKSIFGDSKKNCGVCTLISQFSRAEQPTSYIPTQSSASQDELTLHKGILALMDNVNRLKKCGETFSTEIDSHVRLAERYRDYAVSQIDRLAGNLQQEIEEAVRDVQRFREGAQVIPTNRYFYLLYRYQEGDLDLFTYAVNSDSDMKRLLKVEYTRTQPPEISLDWVETKSPFLSLQTGQPHVLPILSSSDITLYDMTGKQIRSPTPLQQSLDMRNSHWAVLDADRVIFWMRQSLFRFNRKWHMVYLTGKVEVLPDSIVAYDYACILPWQRAIHVFGGECKSEKLSLSLTHWSPLPDMNEAHSQTTAAAWKDCVYICGGFHSRAVEVFNSVQFKLLYFSMPSHTCCVSIVNNDCLEVYTDGGMVVISHRENETGLQIRGLAQYVVFSPWLVEPIKYYDSFVYCDQNGFKTTQITDQPVKSQPLSLFH